MAYVYKPTRVDPFTGDRVKDKYWYIQYRGADGRVRTVKGLRGRAGTLLRATEMERRIERVQGGDAEPSEPQRRRPLREHLADFRRALATERKTAKRVATTLQRLRAVLEACGFFGPTEIDASRVVDWLGEQRESGGLSVASARGHLLAVKAFTAWLVRERRTAVDPLAHLP